MARESDLAFLWIIAPICLSFLVKYLTSKLPYKTKRPDRPWFSPSGYIFVWIWSFIYIVLGLLLYCSYIYEDNTLFYLVLTFTILSYGWSYLYRVMKDYIGALYLLVGLLFLSLCIYTELFYTETTNNDRPDSFGRGFIFLFTPVIVWLIFALNIATQTKH